MTSFVNLQPSPYSFLGGLKVTFIAALGTLLRMPTLYVALRHRVSSWPAASHARCLLFLRGQDGRVYTRLAEMYMWCDQTRERVDC